MRLVILVFIVNLASASAWGAACTPFEENGKQKLTCTVSSGLRPSGKGERWGAFQYVTSKVAGPAGATYELESASFSLGGPHPCSGVVKYAPGQAKKEAKQEWFDSLVSPITGPSFHLYVAPVNKRFTGDWAECQQVKQSDGEVEWEFHFMGWTSSKPLEVAQMKKYDNSCKLPDLPKDKQDACNQYALSIPLANQDEEIKEAAKLTTIWVKTD